MNGLSKLLKVVSNNSCMVGSTVNHLMYADDGVLFSLSSAGLQQLLNMFF